MPILRAVLILALGGAWPSLACGTETNGQLRALAEQVLIASGNTASNIALNRAVLLRENLSKALKLAAPTDASQSAINTAIENEIKVESEEFFKENIDIYSEHFTESQLHDMLTFYNSDGGKALVLQTPPIIQERAIFGRKLGQDAIRRMLASLNPRQPTAAR